MSDSFIEYLFEFLEEIKIIKLMKKLNKEYRPKHFLIHNATIIHTEKLRKEDKISKNQIIRINNGFIEEITSGEKLGELIAKYEIDQIIDVEEKYIFPGLTDSHVHLDLSNSQHLLNIINGITSVREMCGFPYVLRQRELIDQHLMFGPKIYSSGTMLNEFKMGRWTEIITSEEKARKTVRKHKKMGYDFIKVWNRLNLTLLKAAADEAQKQNIPIVGHIPHGVSVENAISVGMRTLEHFKGFIFDNTLTISNKNYLQVISGKMVWNCPTIIIQKNEGYVGDEARKFLKHENMRFVSRYIRNIWTENIPKKVEEANEKGYQSNKRHYDLEVKIFKDLLEIDVQYIAGTDCGGGMIAVPGFVLHDELALFSKLGLSDEKILESATINADHALNTKGKIGQIKKGGFANILVLSENPLEDLQALKKITGLFLMGRYVDKPVINRIRDQIEQIYDKKPDKDEAELISLIENFLSHDENIRYVKPHFYNLLVKYYKKKDKPKKVVEYLKRIFEITENIHDQENLERAKVNV